MKTAALKNTFVTLVIGLFLLMNLQYYFCTNFNNAENPTHSYFTKCLDKHSFPVGGTDLVDEDEKNEKEVKETLLEDIIVILHHHFRELLLHTHYNYLSSKLHTYSCHRVPLYVFLHLLRI